MGRTKLVFLVSWLAFSGALAYPAGSDDLAIWKEFVSALKAGLAIEYKDPECLKVVFRFTKTP